MSRSKLLFIYLLVVAGLITVELALGKKKQVSSQMDDQKRALHALNRLSFGPRPGDVQRVAAMGVDKWIDQQLHPEKIDDSALDAHLEPFRTLRMDTREMVQNFPPAQVIKAVADGRQPMPSNPVKHAIYMAQMEKYEERLEKKQADAPQPAASVETAQAAMTSQSAAAEGAEPDNAASGEMRPAMASEATVNLPAASAPENDRREERQEARAEVQELAALSPDQRFKSILGMSSDKQIALASLRGIPQEELLQGMKPEQQETVMALGNPQQVVGEELMQAKLLREIYSERQLQEVMDDFWLNHFNVFVGKGIDRYFLTSYERDVIRPHALGKFEDLLVATAQSPAMLFYLDNWLSVGPNSDAALGIPRRPANAPWRGRRFPGNRLPANRSAAKQANNRRGLNENYGRELMELHTLGVNGGYAQKDVIEVARAFTGWTLKQPNQGGGFYFDERMHDPGVKIVLGHKIKPNGEKEGLEVLHILAHSPATAHFICNKLAMRFVSDEPPPSLVDRMAQTFLKKDGDIREVLKTMFDSPEFWAPESYRAKVKTPLEFVVSAVRASGADVTDARPLIRQLQIMGMPLYGMQPPTGYSMKATAWVNSSALLDRMNFALALTSGRLRGIEADVAHTLGENNPAESGEDALLALEASLLNGEVAKQTHDTIEARLQNPKISQRRLDDPARPPNMNVIAGLLLGSPDFQRR